MPLKKQAKIPGELLDKISSGNCVLFVGAGLSQGAGLPGWPQTLRQMIAWGADHGVDVSGQRELERLIKNNDLLTVAEEMRERMGKEKFREFMSQTFRKPGLQPTPTHMLLPRIPFVAALTSNYDTLLESAYTLNRQGVAPHTFTHVDTAELSATLRSGEFYILKVHGTIDSIKTVILGEKDYQEIMHASPAYRQHLASLFSTKCVLFLGFGLTDPDLQLLLRSMRSAFEGYAGSHFALMDSSTASAIKRKRFEKDYGVVIIPYKPTAANHPEVQAFLDDLVKASLPTLTAFRKLKEINKSLDVDPHYRIVANTKGEMIIEAKHPDAENESPIIISTRVEVNDDDPEAQNIKESWEKHIKTGAPLRIKNPHTVKFKVPEFMEPFFPSPNKDMELIIGPRRGDRPMPVKIYIEHESGERVSLDYIQLMVAQQGTEEMTLDNETQPVPWKVSLVLNSKEHRFTFNYKVVYTNVNVKQALDGVLFLRALARGGKFWIEGIETGLVFYESQFAAGVYPEPPQIWIELLEKLVYIQAKAKVLLSVPDRDISHEEAKKVLFTAQVLETGHIINHADQLKTSGGIDLARNVLTAYGNGDSHSILFHQEENEIVNIFNVEIDLGPVILTCNQVHIPEDDLKELREAVERSSSEGSIPIKLSAHEGIPFVLRYPKWLPEPEAAAIRSLPIFKNDAGDTTFNDTGGATLCETKDVK
jgi:hypothetical protein